MMIETLWIAARAHVSAKSALIKSVGHVAAASGQNVQELRFIASSPASITSVLNGLQTIFSTLEYVC